MHRTELDGVAVLIHPAPGPLSATLIFRAGTSLATFRTHQVPHLLEHVVLGSLPRVRHLVNGTTSDDHLSFEVSGTPEQVRETLHGICAALADPPLDRFAHEARVVTAEADTEGMSYAGEHSVLRYGPRGAGLAGVDAVPPSEVTPGQVLDFSRTLLVRDNAVLALTGPIPDGLRLQIPEGPRAEIRTTPLAGVSLPALLRRAEDMVGMSIETPAGAGAILLGAILRERIEETLRHGLGITYSVETCGMRLGGDRVMQVIGTQASAATGPRIAREMLSALRDLARHGPEAAELAAQQSDLRTAFSDERTAESLLLAEAWRLLDGHEIRTPEEILAQDAAVSPVDVRGVAQSALSTVLLLVPGEDDADVVKSVRDLGLPDRTDVLWEDEPEISGGTHRRRLLARAPLDLRVVVGDDGLSVRMHGRTATYRWDSILGVEVEDDTYEVLRDDGRSQLIVPSDLRGGDDVVSSILENVGHLAYRSMHDLES